MALAPSSPVLFHLKFNKVMEELDGRAAAIASAPLSPIRLLLRFNSLMEDLEEIKLAIAFAASHHNLFPCKFTLVNKGLDAMALTRSSIASLLSKKFN